MELAIIKPTRCFRAADSASGSKPSTQAKHQDRIIHLADALIAGTALVHGLTVATRNVKDFAGLGVELLNPFSVE